MKILENPQEKKKKKINKYLLIPPNPFPDKKIPGKPPFSVLRKLAPKVL